MTWRIIICGDGTGYLVHVNGENKQEAVAAAKRKIGSLHGKELRVKSAERMVV